MCGCIVQTAAPPHPDFDDDRRTVRNERIGAQPWAVLEFLRRRHGRLVRRDCLLGALPGEPSDRALDVYVCRARRFLRGTDHDIETVRGAGFLLTTKH